MSKNNKNYGIIIDPVVDVTEDSFCFEHKNTNQIDIPFCTEQTTFRKRIHQLIFNEIVEILNENDSLVQIKIPNVIFSDQWKQNDNLFWIKKKSIFKFDNLNKYDIENKIPLPISYLAENNFSEDVVTLSMPYKETSTQMTFSAGTRFKLASSTEKSSEYRTVYFFDQQNKQIKTIRIPHKILIWIGNTFEEKIRQYVNLLKTWANLEDGFIPFVFGGVSFLHTTSDDFQIISKMISGEKVLLYYRNNYYFNPKSGFDCSGLLLRAAQICGIPFYFKNTTLLGSHLRPIKENEIIEIGDLICMNGHVMVASSIENNLLIESGGYKRDFGIVHEISIENVFQNVFSFQELYDLHKKNQMIYRLNKWGEVTDRFPKFKILKLKSIFEIQT